MCRLFERKLALRIRVTVLLFSLGIPAAFAQQSPPLRQETVLTFVHDFLQVFYPDLLSKGHRLILCVDHPADSSWREISGIYFTVKPERPGNYGFRGFNFVNGRPIPEDRPDPNSVLLDGSIWLPPLSRAGRIEEMSTSVSDAVDLKITAFRNLAQSHPEWSDAQAVRALKEAGARFGPDEKEALVKSLPLSQAGRFLGNLRLTSVDFNHLEEERVGSSALLTFDWTVHVEAQFSDGTNTQYVFRFEPFEGKLTFLKRLR